MRYRVVFAKRYASDGEESPINPAADLDVELADGIVADKTFVGRFESEAHHSQEVLDEDDAFLGLAAPEIWEYDVLDGREDEFVDAMKNSETVMEFAVVDEESVDEGDVTATTLDDSGTKVRGGSALRTADDGPAGTVTGDASAGEFGSAGGMLSREEESNAAEGADRLDVMHAGDGRLGLTNVEGKPAEDWAADTGPKANEGAREAASKT